MSKLLKWFWGKKTKSSNPENGPATEKATNLIANESDDLDDESEEEESKNNCNGALDESLKIVEEIKKKREEVKEEEEEEELEEPEKVIVNETLASLSKDYQGYSICNAEEIFEKFKKFK